ncbi:ybaK/ebsC protein [Acanthamoeba castellanii str. Neff]|uniref:YbaK/ebsC protein n=1 Tax=Acanthamoeba castellanii (strain ATCC 30010 / Neff) TaxID=1257118 RepID=L8HFB4_ACACF|nr:ybaK/ebsC protein [Acanthamoeba castellanii str. Neff]ELR23865.1 ybaK/ebsC protein [Acanthamoeba castellanii str. Neff]
MDNTTPALHDEDTPATRFLKERNVAYRTHHYQYIEKGGTNASSNALGVDEHRVVKPFIVLMHGDQRVDTKALAAHLGTKRAAAEEHTGYQVGGTSPFGTKTTLPIFIQRTIVEGEQADSDDEDQAKASAEDKKNEGEVGEIYINGGGRGFLVSLDVKDLVATLQPTLVDVASTKWG